MTKLLFTAGIIASLASCIYTQPPGYPSRRDDHRDDTHGAALGAAAGAGIAAGPESGAYAPLGSPGASANSGGYEQPAAPAAPRTSTGPGNYPYAEKTANPDQVLSPYAPYNVIDVAGFRSGQLARDPSNQKIFRIP